MNLLSYLGKWLNVFDKTVLFNTLDKLGKMYSTTSVLPAQQNIFKAFHECQYDDCKVIMIGADPYPQKNVATGILFSNNIDNKNLSPSLKVIMKASGSTDQTLLSWCKQGVLMINSALSVEEGKPSSHLLLWRPFMTGFLKNLSCCNPGMIYILLGTSAQDLRPYINERFNDVLTEMHPAYYARVNEDMPDTIFRRTNKLLMDKYNQSIKW